jgi:hypothetical protein
MDESKMSEAIDITTENVRKLAVDIIEFMKTKKKKETGKDDIQLSSSIDETIIFATEDTHNFIKMNLSELFKANLIIRGSEFENELKIWAQKTKDNQPLQPPHPLINHMKLMESLKDNALFSFHLQGALLRKSTETIETECSEFLHFMTKTEAEIAINTLYLNLIRRT